MKTPQIHNGQSVALDKIKPLTYQKFYDQVVSALHNDNVHCVTYFAYPDVAKYKFVCALANDTDHTISILSFEREMDDDSPLESLTAIHNAMHIYEREIHENWGVPFENHPWLKPVRYPFDRANKSNVINDYPFYKIETNELHEVGVGPIHAGVIEPGHFRFLCNGENVFHLEIQLGWQHRGVENLFIEKKNQLQQMVLAESICGDTTIGQAWAYAQLIEGGAGIEIDQQTKAERTIALELERIAIHVGDLSAMCTDVAYQLGASTFGALRTPIINFFQTWCGNRFGRGLVRVGGSNYPLTNELVAKLNGVLDAFEKQFDLVATRTFNLPSILKRFEGIGRITRNQAHQLGAVGMVARMADIPRDIRKSHSFGAFSEFEKPHHGTGDVHARAVLRRLEVKQSIRFIRKLLVIDRGEEERKPNYEAKLVSNQLTISLIEGWRGEICHTMITDAKGRIKHYKVKDPSMHNWKALELSLRNLEISDFPINNKSYDLSYCGYDL